MDEQSLYQLDQNTILIVPTGTLATHLGEIYASQQIERGKQVWQAPNIMSWQELLRVYWQQNRADFTDFHSVLSAQQAKLLWTQVIEKSKLVNADLTLLNVQQTVRACMRSHRVLSDWRCDEKALELVHISDVYQFLEWRSNYQALLAHRGVNDDAGLQASVIRHAQRGDHQFSIGRIVWYGYDLITASQRVFGNSLEATGTELLIAGPKNTNTVRKFHCFQDDKHELESVFRAARERLEQKPDQIINIVVPDLQHRYSQVQDIARQTFYPNSSLTDIQNNNLVYRFSLGKPMQQWPAIEVALCVLNLLKPRIAVADLSFLFRSVYVAEVWREKDVYRGFDVWLRGKRIRSLSLERLPVLCAEYAESDHSDQPQEEAVVALPDVQKLIDFIDALTDYKHGLNERLSEQKQSTGYSALGFAEWAKVFSEWLALWQWQTNSAGSELSSVAHQLRGRWDAMLEEFASLGVVQRSIGLASGIANFQQLIRDSVFLPKSAMSPLMVSGLLEALGRETDVCFLTGMTQDFPPANKNDAFIPNQYLMPTGYPDASPQSSVRQASKVMQSLLNSSQEAHVSFAQTALRNQDINNQASPLFISEFAEAEPIQAALPPVSKAKLEAFQDPEGPGWRSPEKARGGSAIFKNQSLCAFKAFATHQLRFKVDDEPEFGLDHLDRGNLTHKMLELLWGKLSSQAALCELTGLQQTELLSNTFEQLLGMSADYLPEDKLRLFTLEKSRVVALCNEWLNIERKRPTNFSVVERESQYKGEWGGIKFDYIIDRVDVTEDGRSAIVDYKTGLVSRNDWLGERPHEPQLPLYALVRDELKSSKVSGIAFAQIRRGKSEFVELAETDIFNVSNKHRERHQQAWQDSRAQWPELFSRLAEEFLAGKADVNPVDKKACQYCELSAVCRVQELTERSRGLGMDLGLAFSDEAAS